MVNTYKLKFTTLQLEIMRLLFIRADASMNAREISLSLDVSAPAISKALPQLEKSRLIIISKDKRSKRLSIKLNRQTHEVIWLKRSDNLKQIYESGLMQYLDENLAGATIILFGSYSSGEDTMRSDIDLAVIGIKYKALELEKFEKILERKIVVNDYEAIKSIDKHLLNNILSGIILKGGIEL